MADSLLSPDVRRFVAQTIDSVEQLEVLVLLAHAAEKWWDAPSVSREAGVTTATAARTLEELGARNLLDVRLGADVMYRFRPSSDALDRLAAALVAAYTSHRLAVLSVLASKPATPIRDFADAFRLKKDT
jgi:hypothetical protein